MNATTKLETAPAASNAVASAKVREPGAGATPRGTGAALAITAALLLGCVLFWAPDASRCDFGPMYVAGYMVRHGQGAKTYDLAEQGRYQQAVVGRHTLLPFPYPPFSTVPFAALAALPYRLAYVVWDVINVALWVSFVLLIRRHAPAPQNTFSYFLVCFAFWPCWVVLLQGQTSLVVLMAYTLAFRSLRDGREQTAGAFLGLGLLKYHFVLPFVAICALRRQWRLIAGFASVALALAAVSAAAVGWSGLLSYGQLMGSAIRNPRFLAVHTQDWLSLSGVLDALTATRSGSGSWLRVLGGTCAVALVLLAAWRWRQEDRREDGGRQDLAFAIAMTVSVVTTSHLLFHDLSLLLLPLLVVIASPQWAQKTVWRSVLIASVGVLYIPPVWALLVNREWLYWLCPALLVFTLAMFALISRRGQLIAAAQGSPLMIPDAACAAAPSSGRGGR